MQQSALRWGLSCLFLFMPMQSEASDAAAAMLFAHGVAWLNGNEVPKSAAIFAGDLVQTRADSTSSIGATGSSVMVLADSLVRFEGPSVDIKRGAVRVGTSRSLVASAGEITVKPTGNSWTVFQVTNLDGRVVIVADKGDVTIRDQESTTTLSQGQQTTRDDDSQYKKKKDSQHKKKKRPHRGGAEPAGRGGILSSTSAIIGASAILGGITIWTLSQDSTPVSPSCPANPCQ